MEEWQVQQCCCYIVEQSSYEDGLLRIVTQNSDSSRDFSCVLHIGLTTRSDSVPFYIF